MAKRIHDIKITIPIEIIDINIDILKNKTPLPIKFINFIKCKRFSLLNACNTNLRGRECVCLTITALKCTKITIILNEL